jgi:hypothetical protein
MDEPREDRLEVLRISLLEPYANAADADADAPADAPAADAAIAPSGNRRSLALSFITLLLSIPALIGA